MAPTANCRNSVDSMKSPRFLLLLCSILVAPFLKAQTTPFGNPFEAAGKPSGPSVLGVRLLSENTTVASGKPFWVAVELEHPDKHHTYWTNSGGLSLPVTIKFTLPEGATAGPIQWALPHWFDAKDEGIRFERFGTTLDLAEITPPAGLAVGQEIEISAEVGSQLCDESSCFPPKTNKVSLKLKVGAESALDAATSKRFNEARASAPRSHPDWKVEVKGNVLTVTPAGTAKADVGEVRYFNFTDEFESMPESQTVSSGTHVIKLKEAKAGAVPSGVLVASKGWADGVPALLVGEISATPAAKPVEPTRATEQPVIGPVDTSDFEKGYTPFETTDSKGLTFVWASVLAFLGGMILNLMPCVFPVLGLKVLSFVKLGGEDPKKIWLHSFAFTMGLVSFVWLFAAVIIVAKAYGTNLNWGFQLQSPTFMAVIVAMLFIMGLWMGGLIEFGSKLTQAGNISTGKGYVSSFLSGVLTTVVATPCTGPFLGSVMGFALQQPALGVFVLFTFLGLGIAAPYLLLAASPKLLKKLPKPGAWMETFKKLLAFPIFMAAAYFLNTFGSLAGLSSMSWFLFALIVAALGLYIFNQWAGPYASGKSKALGSLVAMALVAWSVVLTVGAIKERVVPSAEEKDWLTWSPELIDKLRSEGRTVFVDFTTPGCLTCQANERLVFKSPGSEAVIAQMKKYNVALVLANDRGQDPRIFETANSVGREGYPTNLIYPGKKKPLLLREALTQEHVMRAIEEAERLKR